MNKVPQKDCSEYLIKAVLMSRYHQPYSEIEKIPLKEIIFYKHLIAAEDRKAEIEMEKLKKQARVKKFGKGNSRFLAV